MSQITSPVILDSTGVRIAAAIEALGGGGSGATGCVTDLGGTLYNGIVPGPAFPSGYDIDDNQVSSFAFTFFNGLLVLDVSIYNPTPSAGGRVLKLATFPNMEVSDSFEANAFQPFLPATWSYDNQLGACKKSMLHNLLNQDQETTSFYFTFAKDSSNNNVWTLSLVYTNSSAINDYVNFYGIMDLHYSDIAYQNWEF